MYVDGAWQGGLVAESNAERITVALDTVEWLDLTPPEALVARISTLTLTDGGIANGCRQPFFVANFSWSEATPSRPTGMLIGPSNTVLGGLNIGYLAHYARPASASEFGAGTRSRRGHYLERSFGMGDVLKWDNDSSKSSTVVRVVYEPAVEKTTK